MTLWLLPVACGKKEAPKKLVSARDVARQLAPPNGWHEVLDGRRAGYIHEIAADDGSSSISVATRRMLFGKVPPPYDGRVRGVLKAYPESAFRHFLRAQAGDTPGEVAHLVAVRTGRLGGLDALVLRVNHRNGTSGTVRGAMEFLVPGHGGWVIVELGFSNEDEGHVIPRLLGILNRLVLDEPPDRG